MRDQSAECLISSSFSISSPSMDPEECTDFLEIQPSSTGKKGHKRTPQSYGQLITSFWSIGPHKEPGDDIDEGMQKVLQIVWPAKERIGEYLKTRSYHASFGTTVNIYESRPLYRLRPETLQKMAFFGVEYIFDIHDYSD